MRFDDSIRTVLAFARAPSDGARAIAFQQLVDLLAQGRGQTEPALRDEAFAVLEELRPHVPPALRRQMVQLVARIGADVRMVRLFLAEPIADLARLLTTARLDEREWLDILPLLPAPARAVMRERRDLPDMVRRALGALGPADSMLEPPADLARVMDLFVADPMSGDLNGPQDPAPEFMPAAEPPLQTADPAITASEQQVRNLLKRLAEFRAKLAERGESSPALMPRSPVQPPVQAAPFAENDVSAAITDLRWESDQRGWFTNISGAPAELLAGRSLLDIDGVGADAVKAALRRRVPFRNIPIRFEAAVPLPDYWLLAGVPFFDPRDGRFLGFRGTAIRAGETEVRAYLEVRGKPTTRSNGGLFGTGASSDTLSSMAHEVRTPLNAIMGFAQMIEGEVLGPAGQDYRERASVIMSNAERLLGALDDLTDAARLDQGRYTVDRQRFSIALLVERVGTRYGPMATERQILFVPSIAAGLPQLYGDERSTERALGRLLTAVFAAAGPGETVVLGVQAAPADHVRIFVTRPVRLAGLSAETLLDPGGIAQNQEAEAPILGIGFGLRLVRQLAAVLGGRFEIEPHLFTLTLPPMLPEEKTADAQRAS